MWKMRENYKTFQAYQEMMGMLNYHLHICKVFNISERCKEKVLKWV
jgi:hypothetical protein